MKRGIFCLGLLLMGAVAEAGWQQTFSDDFNGTTLNASVWTSTDYWGQRNNVLLEEQQCYLDAQNSVAGGLALLRADITAPAFCNPLPSNLLYRSGQITTANSFAQAYGYFEVRAKVPAGAGFHAGFKLEPLGGFSPSYPPEIFVGRVHGATPTQVTHEYSFLNEFFEIVRMTHQTNGTEDLSSGFHRYGVDWQPGLLIWYVDGVEVHRLAANNIYDQGMYLTLQLPVGSTILGTTDVNTVFPATFEVDYVRAFRRVDDGTPDILPPSPDAEAPVVSIVPPKRREVTKDRVVINASATDNVGVTGMKVFVDNALACSSNVTPVRCVYRMPRRDRRKSLVVRVEATDAAGNVGAGFRTYTLP